MAIDNDTSYELTGAQIKDLAQKIRNKADDNTFVGSSSGTAGSKGLVPAPAAGDQNKVLKGDGAWGAVTSANIDWSTVIETVGSGDNICYKFPDGLMIAVVKKTASVTWGAWAGWYESQAIDPPNFAQAFTAVPFCVASIMSGGQAALGMGTGRTGTGSACTATKGQSVVLMRPNDVSQSFTICWQAIGRWK